MILTDVEVKICPRVNASGNKFTEIFYTFRRDGVLNHALTRTWAEMDDSPYSRGYERVKFIERQQKMEVGP